MLVDLFKVKNSVSGPPKEQIYNIYAAFSLLTHNTLKGSRAYNFYFMVMRMCTFLHVRYIGSY